MQLLKITQYALAKPRSLIKEVSSPFHFACGQLCKIVIAKKKRKNHVNNCPSVALSISKISEDIERAGNLKF